MRAVVTNGTARIAQIEGIAVAVFVENAGFGSTAAAPIASLLIEQYLTGTVAREDLVRRLVEEVRSEPAQ
jgi:penicillin-binding protein 2